MQFIFWLALSALFVVLGMAFIVYHAVERLAEASCLFEGRTAPALNQDSDWARCYAETDQWARAQGMVSFDCLDFFGLLDDQPVHIGSWKHPEQSFYLVLYFFMEKTWVDFTSTFANAMYLTTSNQRDALTLPEPESACVQVFANANLDTLYGRHQSATAYLTRHLQTQSVIRPLSLRQLMVEAMEKQVASIKAQPMWYLNGAVWYFWRRIWLNNKSVEHLYPQKMLTSR